MKKKRRRKCPHCRELCHLFRLQFLDDAANVVLIGGVGLGKSHLAIALGYTACQRGHSVLVASAIDIVNTLMAAQAGGRLKSELNRYVRPRLLLIDELGYLPIDKAGADLLFQIISQRYERGSTVITTNRVYGVDDGSTFGCRCPLTLFVALPEGATSSWGTSFAKAALVATSKCLSSRPRSRSSAPRRTD